MTAQILRFPKKHGNLEYARRRYFRAKRHYDWLVANGTANRPTADILYANARRRLDRARQEYLSALQK